MVARQHHVGDLGGDVVDPLLPQVPVGLVHHRDVTALGATLVRRLARRQRRVVALGVVAGGQLRRGAIVADGPVVLAGEHATVPVVGVAEVTAVPREAHAALGDGLDQLGIRAISVGVAHVVEHGDGEGRGAAGGGGGGEGEHRGRGGAVGRGNLVAVGRTGLEVLELDVMEELATLSSRDQRAGRRAVVAGSCQTVARVRGHVWRGRLTWTTCPWSCRSGSWSSRPSRWWGPRPGQRASGSGRSHRRGCTTAR